MPGNPFTHVTQGDLHSQRRLIQDPVTPPDAHLSTEFTNGTQVREPTSLTKFLEWINNGTRSIRGSRSTCVLLGNKYPHWKSDLILTDFVNTPTLFPRRKCRPRDLLGKG